MLIKCNIQREGATVVNHGGVPYSFGIQPGLTGNQVDKVCEVAADHAIARFLDAEGLFEEWTAPEEAVAEAVRQEVKDWVDDSLEEMGEPPVQKKKAGRTPKEKPVPVGEGPVTTPFSDDLGIDREPTNIAEPVNEAPKPENNGADMAELF